MIQNMHVIPWDQKALRAEVDRIVGNFLEKEGPKDPLKTEEKIPKMQVIPWDLKALRQEVGRIVRSF